MVRAFASLRWFLRLSDWKMKITIRLEMNERGPQSGTGTSVISRSGDFPQRDMSCRISANFVAQVAATFFRFPQTCARRRNDLPDVIRIYDHAVAPKLVPAGTTIRCKT
jgi:hypothetical protein